MAADSFTVIVTHEHTDFDALASMLGAHKLFPEAVPVLPRTLNRNLREFLALYRSGLPFRQQEELPRRPVERVIVVDTQSFTTVRGMRPDTPGLVIDHHELPAMPEPGWSHWGGDVGATATLLVEKMAERGLALTPLEATLLLLGIYEDTGSLVYVTTTPRDLRCGRLAAGARRQPAGAAPLPAPSPQPRPDRAVQQAGREQPGPRHRRPIGGDRHGLRARL